MDQKVTPNLWFDGNARETAQRFRQFDEDAQNRHRRLLAIPSTKIIVKRGSTSGRAEPQIASTTDA